MNNSPVNKNQLTAAIIGLVLIIASIFAYDLFIFRLKNTQPANNSVATTAPFVKFTFSQPVKSVEKITLKQGDTSVEMARDITGNSVHAKFASTLNKDFNYTITLEGIHSQWFGNTVKSVSYNFTPVYKGYGSFTKEEQKALVDKSNSGQIDDKFLNNQFPLAGDGFYVNVNRFEGEEKLHVEVVILAEVYNPDTDTQATVPDDQAEQYHQKAMQLIRDKGGNPDNYIITYSNPYLNNKYSQIKED